MVVKTIMNVDVTTSAQTREVPAEAPTLEAMVMVPGPTTTAAVINPGPRFFHKLDFETGAPAAGASAVSDGC